MAAEAELCHTSLGWSYSQALAAVSLVMLWCGFWLHLAGRVLPPGFRRLAAAAPVVAINFLLPTLFCRWEESTTIVMMRQVQLMRIVAASKARQYLDGTGQLQAQLCAS